jgi:hypothetical protein
MRSRYETRFANTWDSWFHQTVGASVIAWLLITLWLQFWLTVGLLVWLSRPSVPFELPVRMPVS